MERVSSPYAILRNKDFLFYLLGRFVASFGQQMLTVAVGWEIYDRTHSSLLLGLVGLTAFIPMVLTTLPAGHMADTRERKRIIIYMQGVLACTSLGLAYISWKQEPVIWMYICLLMAGVARTFLWSASASFLPQLVARQEFPLAVTWSSSTFQFSAVAGPAAGGALIALSHNAAVLVYLLTSLSGIVCLSLICLVRAHSKPAPKEPFSRDTLLGGFRFVFRHRIILAAITLDLFAVLFGGATALLPVYAKDILRVGPRGLGLLQAALPVGSMLCAMIMAHRPPMQKAGRSLIWAVTIFGLATVGFGYSKVFWLSLLMLFICGFVDNVSVIVRHTLVQLLTPDSMRGRVSSVNNLFIGTSNELGGFESGLAANYFGPVFSVVSGGIATILVVGAVAWIWPEIPRFGRLVQPADETEPGAVDVPREAEQGKSPAL
ncbi:MAG TPA: MFS transporter [Verrucomicrobiae bacterium]